MPDINTIRVILPQPTTVRIAVPSNPQVIVTSVRIFGVPGNAVQKQTDYPTPETENDIIACLQNAGLCA